MEKETLYQELRQRVESVLGRPMKTPKDFDFLVIQLSNCTHTLINNYTLKRFWGYLKSTDVRVSTLNTLCQFIGYTSFDAFERSVENGTPQSSPILTQILFCSELNRGDRIRLVWNPGRIVIARFEGIDLFTVEDSINSKLQIGDTFHCQQMVNQQPLVLTCLVHAGMEPCNYVCGEKDGILFERLR